MDEEKQRGLVITQGGGELSIAKKVLEILSHNEVPLVFAQRENIPEPLPFINYIEEDCKYKEDPKSGKEKRRERRKSERKLKKR